MIIFFFFQLLYLLFPWIGVWYVIFGLIMNSFFVVIFFLLVCLLFLMGSVVIFIALRVLSLLVLWSNLIVVDMSALYDQFYRLAPHTVIPSSYYACFTCDFLYVFDVIVLIQWMLFVVVLCLQSWLLSSKGIGRIVCRFYDWELS